MLLPRRPIDRDLLDRAHPRELVAATARTRRTGRDAPCRSGRRAARRRRRRARSCAACRRGRSRPRRPSSGRPPSAIAAWTSATVARIGERARDRAPLPPHRQVGRRRLAPQRLELLDVPARDGQVLVVPSRCSAGTRTSTCTTAIVDGSRRSPRAAGSAPARGSPTSGGNREADPHRSPPPPGGPGREHRVHEARPRTSRPTRRSPSPGAGEPGCRPARPPATPSVKPPERPHPADPVDHGPRGGDRRPRSHGRHPGATISVAIAAEDRDRGRRRAATSAGPRHLSEAARSSTAWRRRARTRSTGRAASRARRCARGRAEAAARRRRTRSATRRPAGTRGEVTRPAASADGAPESPATAAGAGSHHAQSRQSILFLSASWLRCFTRKHSGT